ncbi:TorF family putative porin [Bdellovibrio bacteriovorus]|uniref:TorF family putative porin n=1 Tax=Bdellovibrio bacteriovorus TaxID=959 RepID=UPI003AA98D1F
MRRYIAFTIILISTLGASAAKASTSPTFALSGDVSLLSHYVEHGLSQSDNSPALQGSFWFNFGSQFRLGVWGSNTNYEHGDDHFNLRMNAEVKVDFSQNASMEIGYTKSQYYNGGDHNGDLLSLHLNLWKSRIMYDTNSNWEATHEKSERFGFGNIMDVFGGWKWNNEIGYNTPDVETINPYFDARTGLGTKWGVIFFEGALTATSESSQFDGAGDYFFILSASTDL